MRYQYFMKPEIRSVERGICPIAMQVHEIMAGYIAHAQNGHISTSKVLNLNG